MMIPRYLVLFLFSVLSYGVKAGVIFQPWSSAETSLFTSQGAAGSGWVGNTLTLNFGPVPGYQTIDANSFTSRLPNFFPANTIGIQFGVGSSLLGIHEHWAGVDIEGTGLPLEPNEYVLERVATTQRSTLAITDWELYLIRQPFDPRVVLIDIPELTSSDVTTVQVLFLQSVLNAPAQLLGFYADGGGSSGGGTAGTTTFSDVSWLICTSDCSIPDYLSNNSQSPNSVPEPNITVLLMIGLLVLLSLPRFSPTNMALKRDQ